MRHSFSFLFLVLFLSVTRAAPLERDLGGGLLYFRVHSLPADLPAAAPKSHPLVLDLRYATTTPDGATALAAWLKFRATPNTPVFVMLNADTAPALRAAFSAGSRPGAGVVTFAPRSSALTPDIALDVAADADRRAYDALEHGASVESLITENTGKTRHDEAELARERANPSSDSDDAEPAAEPPDRDKVAPPAPPIDRLLERVVEVHRGLLALHRLS